MPKLLQISVISLLVATGVALMSGSTAHAEPKTGPTGATIDNIVVPYEVLIYAQLEYQGHAVTKATKVVENGQELYRLKVDRDDDEFSDTELIHLLYDKKWELVDQKKMKLPEPVLVREIPNPPPEPEEPDDDNKPAENDRVATPKPDPDAVKPEEPEQPEPEEPDEDHDDEPELPPHRRRNNS